MCPVRCVTYVSGRSRGPARKHGLEIYRPRKVTSQPFPARLSVLSIDAGTVASKNPACVGGSFSFIFVFAIRIHVDALAHPSIETFSPASQLLRRVILQTQPHVREVRRQHVWWLLLFCLRNAQGRLMLPENLIRFLHVPRRVAHLESKQKSRRPQRQKILQQWLVELEGWRKLHQDWAKVIPCLKHTRHFHEAL